MKTRVSFLSTILSAPLFLAAAPAFVSIACGGSSSGSPDGGGGGGGTGGGETTLDPKNLLSSFEDASAATVVQEGDPKRNGYWYPYNDMTTGCMQTPKNGDQYLVSTPPTPSPNGGGMALHAQWMGCGMSGGWGAGVGADLNQPILDGGTYTGPKVPYDLTGYTGITFWAASSSATADTKLRVKLPMTDETKTTDGGNCVESPTNKCSDDFGQTFSMQPSGAWTQVTVKFSETSKFKQEGWGATFKWKPENVTSIQIQNQGTEKLEAYDFWIDDVYLTK